MNRHSLVRPGVESFFCAEARHCKLLTRSEEEQIHFAQDDSPFPKLNTNNLIGGGHLLGLSALPESVLESAGHGLHVSHAAGADGAAALGLGSVVEIPHLLAGISAGRAGLLLDVIRHLAASAAGGVRLVVSLSERGGTLGLLVSEVRGGEVGWLKRSVRWTDSYKKTYARPHFSQKRHSINKRPNLHR